MKKIIQSLILLMIMVSVVDVDVEATESVSPKPARTFETSADILREIHDDPMPFFVCPDGDLRACEQTAYEALRACSEASTGGDLHCIRRFGIAIDICNFFCLV